MPELGKDWKRLDKYFENGGKKMAKEGSTEDETEDGYIEYPPDQVIETAKEIFDNLLSERFSPNNILTIGSGINLYGIEQIVSEIVEKSMDNLYLRIIDVSEAQDRLRNDVNQIDELVQTVNTKITNILSAVNPRSEKERPRKTKPKASKSPKRPATPKKKSMK